MTALRRCWTGWTPPTWVSVAEGNAILAHSIERVIRSKSPAGVKGRASGLGGFERGLSLVSGVLRSEKGNSWTKNGAKYVVGTTNMKTGPVDITWVSIQATCIDCRYKETDTCYTFHAQTQTMIQKLDADAEGIGSYETTLDEVACIDSSHDGKKIPPGTVLRIHGSGDCSTVEGAKALGGAIERWHRRGGQTAYTYTHAWRVVPRSAFGSRLSVLASVDNLHEARAALAAGYGSITTLVPVDEWFKNMRVTRTGGLSFRNFDLPQSQTKLKFIACPAQYPTDSVRDGKLVMGEAARWKRVFFGKMLGFVPKPHGTAKKLLKEGELVSIEELEGGGVDIVELYPDKHPRTGSRYETIEATIRVKDTTRTTPSGQHPVVEQRVKVPVPYYSPEQKQMLLSRGILPLIRNYLGAESVLHVPEGLRTRGLTLRDKIAFDTFRLLMRYVRDDEGTTCSKCRACFSDKELGRKGQAVAFQPDHSSGGIIRTAALLQKRQIDARVAEAMRLPDAMRVLPDVLRYRVAMETEEHLALVEQAAHEETEAEHRRLLPVPRRRPPG